DPVVLRQPLVDERIVRGQKIQHASVRANDAVEEHLRFAPEALPKLIVEVRELARVWERAPQIPEVQPLAGEITDERLRSLVGQHAAGLLVENGRILEAPAPRQPEQLVI